MVILKFLFWIMVFCVLCWVAGVARDKNVPGCKNCADWERCRGGDLRCWWRE